jgi:hypothetical protein
MLLTYGDTAAREVSKRIGAPVANAAEMIAIPADRRIDGQLFTDLSDGSAWRFKLASSVADGAQSTLTRTPTAGSGRFLRLPGAARLALPITFATADAAVLLTVPAGCLLNLRELFWTVTADFTGGSSSAIGVSSTKTGFTTKGDLLGGAAGNVAAALTALLSPALGTIGAEFDTLAKRRVLWLPAEIIRFDRITSVFTAGAGAVNVICDVLQNDGA